jgi:hypothetical protein
MSGNMSGFDDGERLVPRQPEAELPPTSSASPPSLVPRQVASPGRALDVVDFGSDAGAGGENLDLDELLTPFLRMMQGLSPEINPSKGEYVPGATLGAIMNTATKEFWSKDGLDVVVCDRSHHYGKWVPRDLGGGYRGQLATQDDFVKRCIARAGGNKFRLPRYKNNKWTVMGSDTAAEPIKDPESGDLIELVETGQLYVLYAPHGHLIVENARRAIISMTSTAMRSYTGFINRWVNWTYPQPDGSQKPAPLWAYRWHLTTRLEEKDGNSWFNWNLQLLPEGASAREALLQRDDPLYVKGREFYELSRAGAIKIDQEAVAPADPDAVPF